VALDTTAKRFAAAGVPYPGVGFNKLSRGALALVAQPTPAEALNATLGEFTASFSGTSEQIEWSARQRASIALLPRPGLNADVRAALAGIPSRRTTGIDADAKVRASIYGMGWPGINGVVRGGLAGVPSITETPEALVATLGDFSISFTGSVENPGEHSGSIDVTLDSFTASFEGEHYYSLYFDVTYGIVPTWVAHELPAVSGAIDATLEAFSASLAGTVLPAEAIDGGLALSLGEFAVAFAGDFTAPASVDGAIGLDIEVFGLSFRGTAVPEDGSIGVLGITLDGFEASFSGTAEAPEFSGAVDGTLGTFTTTFRGQFIDAGAKNGQISLELGSFLVDFTGTSDRNAGDPVIAVTRHRGLAVRTGNDSLRIRRKVLQ
jgi:hypothetical protein